MGVIDDLLDRIFDTTDDEERGYEIEVVEE